jgi:hypothetical protein
MARKPSLDKFATKKEFEKHKKEVFRMIKKSMKDIKKWDTKQDKKLIRKRKKRS